MRRADTQVFNQTLEIFNHLFKSLLGAELTTKQTALFNYLTMLMLALPKAMGCTSVWRSRNYYAAISCEVLVQTG